MPKLKKSKRSLRARLKKQPLLMVAVVVLLVAGGGIAYAQLKDDPQPNSSEASDTDALDGNEDINLDPASDEERQESEEHKKNLAEDKPGSVSDAPDSGQQVTPVITSASRTEVNAYVSGVFEEGGTCTATATKGSQVVSTSSQGFENVSYTSCAPIIWDSPLGAGSWSVVVTYSSSTGSGQSEAVPVN